MSRDSKKTLQDHGTQKHLILKSRISATSEYFAKHALGFQSIPDESRARLDTIVINLEKHLGTNRDCFIWIRFGDLKSGDKGFGP